MIYTVNNCNNILSFNKYSIETYEYYKKISIIDNVMHIVHNNTKELHDSMGLSMVSIWRLRNFNLYSLFKAKSSNNISLNKKFKIYIGRHHEVDWIVLDKPLTNNWSEYKLTTTFYFEKNEDCYTHNKDGFRIGFVEPEGNMEYSKKIYSLF